MNDKVLQWMFFVLYFSIAALAQEADQNATDSSPIDNDITVITLFEPSSSSQFTSLGITLVSNTHISGGKYGNQSFALSFSESQIQYDQSYFGDSTSTFQIDPRYVSSNSSDGSEQPSVAISSNISTVQSSLVNNTLDSLYPEPFLGVFPLGNIIPINRSIIEGSSYSKTFGINLGQEGNFNGSIVIGGYDANRINDTAWHPFGEQDTTNAFKTFKGPNITAINNQSQPSGLDFEPTASIIEAENPYIMLPATNSTGICNDDLIIGIADPSGYPHNMTVPKEFLNNGITCLIQEQSAGPVVLGQPFLQAMYLLVNGTTSYIAQARYDASPVNGTIFDAGATFTLAPSTSTSASASASATSASSTTSKKKGNHAGAIAGGVIGGLVASALLLLLGLYLLRRYKKRQQAYGQQGSKPASSQLPMQSISEVYEVYNSSQSKSTAINYDPIPVPSSVEEEEEDAEEDPSHHHPNELPIPIHPITQRRFDNGENPDIGLSIPPSPVISAVSSLSEKPDIMSNNHNINNTDIQRQNTTASSAISRDGTDLDDGFEPVHPRARSLSPDFERVDEERFTFMNNQDIGMTSPVRKPVGSGLAGQGPRVSHFAEAKD
ncbi:MAG: hypothetical protein M1827_003730 [Pycnora praestabilis]|nr:MAG: hypothetical protein M1827_003730 [Pycnora praestabilis]